MELTKENYYSHESNVEYMSVSQYKSFLRCEAKAMALLNGEFKSEKSKALLIGSYVDAYFDDTLEEFKEKNPAIFTRKGDLRAEFKRANQMIERATSDDYFMKFMSGQKQVIETAELFGCNWKIRIDSLGSDFICDLKTCRSFDRIGGNSFIEAWRYDTQLAVYQKVHEISTGETLPVYIAAITKEDVPDIEIISIPQWRLNECLDEVQARIPAVLQVKNGEKEPTPCGCCDYCKSTKKLTEPIDFELIGFNNYERERM